MAAMVERDNHEVSHTKSCVLDMAVQKALDVTLFLSAQPARSSPSYPGYVVFHDEIKTAKADSRLTTPFR